MPSTARERSRGERLHCVLRATCALGGRRRFVALEPRLQLVDERSYNVEMRKHTLRGKLFAATFGKDVNNRLALFAW